MNYTIPEMPVHYIPFVSLTDLKEKVGLLDKVYHSNSTLLKDTLGIYNVKYQELEDGALSLEAHAIPEHALQAVTDVINLMTQNIKNAYAAVGVVLPNSKTPYNIYESLIQVLKNNN